MELLYSALSAGLGAIAGIVIAYLVPDETAWYPKWFLLAAVCFAILAGVLVWPVWVGVIALLVFCLGTWKRQVWIVAISGAVLAVTGDLLVWQFLFLALLFSAGYLYSQKLRYELLWFLTFPAIVLLGWFIGAL